MRDLIPTLSRVGLLQDAPEVPQHARAWEEAAGRLRIATQSVMVRKPDEIDAALADFHKQRVDAIFVSMAGPNFSHRYRITTRATQLGIPTFSIFGELFQAGGLLSYGLSLADVYRRGATYVDKVLRGASAATVPIEQPSKIELVLDLKTARSLRVVIPPSLLLRVDHVIE